MSLPPPHPSEPPPHFNPLPLLLLLLCFDGALCFLLLLFHTMSLSPLNLHAGRCAKHFGVCYLLHRLPSCDRTGTQRAGKHWNISASRQNGECLRFFFFASWLWKLGQSPLGPEGVASAQSLFVSRHQPGLHLAVEGVCCEFTNSWSVQTAPVSVSQTSHS